MSVYVISAVECLGACNTQCVCICMCAHTGVSVCVCTDVYTCARVCVHMWMSMCMCVHMWVCMCVHAYEYARVHMWGCVHVCVRTHGCLCVHRWVCIVCACVCIWVYRDTCLCVSPRDHCWISVGITWCPHHPVSACAIHPESPGAVCLVRRPWAEHGNVLVSPLLCVLPHGCV